MFETVPRELTEALRLLPEGMKSPDLRHLAAGGLVTAHYLRNHGPLHSSGLIDDGRLEREDAARLVQIGDLLFTLRMEPGFGALCRQLRDAPLGFALFELTIAMMFKRHGFAIHARPHAGFSRYDYSFRATKSDAAVNVAAVGFGDQRFSRDCVLSALWRRRRRLPDDAPAVLLCLHPADWRKDAWDLDFDLRAIASQLLREAKRINYLLFAQESFSPVDGGGVIALSAFAACNDAARLPCPPLDDAMAQIVAQGRGSPATASRLDEGAFGYGDFDQWVNWAVDAE